MFMERPTCEMIKEWEEIHRQYRDKLKPNRKSGQKIVNYLNSKYSLIEIHDDKALEVVSKNVLMNEHIKEKLTLGTYPNPVAFYLENISAGKKLYETQDDIFQGNKIFIGIDLSSGYYCIEGSSNLWDELCAFQGLDPQDLDNYYCVAQYISCLKQFNMLKE